MLCHGESMSTNNLIRVIFLSAILALAAGNSELSAQEKLTVSYSSVDAPTPTGT